MVPSAEDRAVLAKKYKKLKFLARISGGAFIASLITTLVIANIVSMNDISVASWFYLSGLLISFSLFVAWGAFSELNQKARLKLRRCDSQIYDYEYRVIVAEMRVAGFGECEMMVSGLNRAGETITSSIYVNADMIKRVYIGDYFNEPIQ